MSKSGLEPVSVPDGWKAIYHNPLASDGDVAPFWMEGGGKVSFPSGRMRLESADGTNFVYWCPDEFPADIAVEWSFRPLREPGLCILFAAARGRGGEDLFHPRLKPRTGDYPEYHHGDINALHVSYFRRRWEEERRFHTCNLRKSHGFQLVAQGADPIPDAEDADKMYRLLFVKQGASVTFAIDSLRIFEWADDGRTYGPVLGGGKIGFRQMAPMVAEYADLTVYAP